MQSCSHIPMLPLSDGCDMPQLGMVSFRKDPQQKFKDLLMERLDQGIRHIEISDLFGNGHTVVEAVLDGDVPLDRENVFFTLKIWPKTKTYQDLIDSFKEALYFMGLGYVDLLLIHAPIDINNRLDQWKALEYLKSEGLAKSIGGSNMTHAQLSNILKVCTVIPAVVEMEVTPFGQRLDIVEFCSDNAIIVLSDNPLAKEINCDNHPEFLEICQELDLTPQQVLVKWVINKGYGILLPPSNGSIGSEPSILIEEPLSKEMIDRLDALDEGQLTAWETNEEAAVEE